MNTSDRPTVLFVCTHNAGRSALGAALTRHHAGDTVNAISAGVDPAEAASPTTIQSLAGLGIDDSHHRPTVLTEDMVADSTVVVAMKPGLDIPHVDGVQYETWELPNPEGWGVEAVDHLRDDIQRQVIGLIDRLRSRE